MAQARDSDARPRGRARSWRQASPEARRAQILEAALRCFSAKGYHAATMDDLAREAGLSKGSLYWHYPSKRNVFLALADAFVLELFEAWRRAAAEAPPGSIDFLGRVGELLIGAVTAHEPMLRAWAELLTHREVQERFAAIYRQSRALLGEWVEQGVARGEIAPVPAAGMAAGLTAAVEGLLLQAMVDPAFDPRAHWPALWAVLARGLRP